MEMIASKKPTLDRLLSDASLVRHEAYIGGAWLGGAETLSVTNPADGALLGTVPALGEAETERTIGAAKAAMSAWNALLPQERAAHLRRWFELILANREDLASLITLEQGKPLWESRGEVDYGASFVEWSAEEAKRLSEPAMPSHKADAVTRLYREPVGVAALITPWNFPLAMVTRKAAAALAAGCGTVVHPSGETPFTALALAVLAERAGLPAGLFNVVTGDPATVVGAMTASPKVAAVSFTGSTEIGRLIAGQCAPTMKRMIMELGGHAPFLLFPDADLDKAVEGAVGAKFATSGQDCLAANRIYVHRDVYDDFVARFTERVAAMKVGHGFDESVEIGPLMHERAVAKCKAHIEDAVAKGARLTTGGETTEDGPLFLAPTVLADVPEDARILEEETFGPVAAILPFEDEAAVTEAANDTEYGLIAYLYTDDYRRIERLSRALDYGMVAVNRASVTGAPIPFGGVKQSGLGREGARQGVEAFTEIRYVCIDIG